MNIVYKYPLTNDIGVPQELRLPKDAEIVKFGIQRTIFYVWARVETDSPDEVRTFQIASTGQPIATRSIHIDTIFDRIFVWHLFELKPASN